MNNLKKLTEYAVSEIVMAENYIKLAECYFENENISSKFQEIAKDELKHHNYDIEVIKSKINEEKEKGNVTQELENSLLYDVYYEWFKSVENRVNNFKTKR